MTTDREHLTFLHNRLVEVHDEPFLVDYLHRLRSIILSLEPDKSTPSRLISSNQEFLKELNGDTDNKKDERLAHDDRVEFTQYIVEATNVERFLLWEKWHESVAWKSDTTGKILEIGHVNDRKVCVDLQWAEIMGIEVLFYHGSSSVVDHDMIEEWLKNNFKAQYFDAANFYMFINKIRKADEG